MSGAPDTRKAPSTTVPFPYLKDQFAAPDGILAEIRALALTGDFTLGRAVGEFERAFADFVGAKHAIGVNSGTDALKLSLMAAGVGPGDEVITAANTFIATVGAIHEVGARPVFVDVDDSFCLSVEQMAQAISPRTRAIIPVHLTGNVADMESLLPIAQRHGIPVIEDACQAIGSRRNGKAAGTWGLTGTYSLHPMKFLNIWGDGGVIVTDDDSVDRKLRLLRNHGLVDRDTIVMMGCNSRLDTLQAVVAKRLLQDADEIVAKRTANAQTYDDGLAGIRQVKTPRRDAAVLHTYVTYQILAEDRDGLLAHCQSRGVDAKIHYPVPVYRQEGLRRFGYKAGDFPVTDRQAATTLTLPVHQYLERAQLQHAISIIREYYNA
jgi:dTDP-3-amino-2,3,6-trideoxy-4-keto-D-glucose/dTDP-3-amino-3,4,6-trideoxy-alpha-D-glucose/dTDP-2,6-dideoxy-D-kanosamine transaminase